MNCAQNYALLGRASVSGGADGLEVGNKCDLEDERDVKKEEGEALAAEFECPFFETSAKDHINVDECFRELVREVRRFKEQEAPSKSDAGGDGKSGGAAAPKKKKAACKLL